MIRALAAALSARASAPSLWIALAAAAAGGWAVAKITDGFAGRRCPRAPMAVAAVGAALSVVFTPTSPEWAWSLILAGALLLLGAVDILALRLPNAVTFPLIAAGLLHSTLAGGGFDAAAGALLGYALVALVDRAYRIIRGRQGLGLGDAKLFAGAGAWLGWESLPSVLLVTCTGGLIWAALRMLREGRSSLASQLPLGAPMALAIWVHWTWLKG